MLGRPRTGTRIAVAACASIALLPAGAGRAATNLPCSEDAPRQRITDTVQSAPTYPARRMLACVASSPICLVDTSGTVRRVTSVDRLPPASTRIVAAAFQHLELNGRRICALALYLPGDEMAGAAWFVDVFNGRGERAGDVDGSIDRPLGAPRVLERVRDEVERWRPPSDFFR